MSKQTEFDDLLGGWIGVHGKRKDTYVKCVSLQTMKYYKYGTYYYLLRYIAIIASVLFVALQYQQAKIHFFYSLDGSVDVDNNNLSDGRRTATTTTQTHTRDAGTPPRASSIHQQTNDAVFVVPELVQPTMTTKKKNEKVVNYMYDVCFVTCVFGKNSSQVDTVGDVHEHRRQNPKFDYILFTNLDELGKSAEFNGWKTFVEPNLQQRLNLTRMITVSRYYKFMPYQSQYVVDNCYYVFYLDGYTLPINTPEVNDKFQQLATYIVSTHPYGLGQYIKYDVTIARLADMLQKQKKDYWRHIRATMTWLRSQDDYRKNRPNQLVYLNRHIGIDPHNTLYRKMSWHFWKLYSEEIGSFRDQLLWSYVVDIYHAKPYDLNTLWNSTKENLFQENFGSMGYHGHTYVNEDGKLYDLTMKKLA